MSLYRVTLPNNIVAGLEVSPDGTVTHAAPILKKSVGLRIDQVKTWAKRKGGTVILVSGESIYERKGKQP